MNEIGVQQIVNAKARTSASDQPSSHGSKDVESKTLIDRAGEQMVELKDSAKESQEAKKEVPDKAVEKAVAQLNDYVQNTERKLEFQVDEESGETVVRVYDKLSDELIRQMPNEEALELAQRLNEEEPLMLFSAQV